MTAPTTALDRRAMPRGWLALAILALLLVLALGAFIVGSPRPPVPPPFNGMISFGRMDGTLGDTVSYVINPDGTHERKLRPETHEGTYWSPDGSKVGLGGGYVNADGTGYKDFGDAWLPLYVPCWDWSPDGRSCLAEGWDETDPSRNGLYLRDIDDAEAPVQLTHHRDVPGVFSRDGQQVAFQRDRRLWVVQIDGTGERAVGGLQLPAGGTDLSWSAGRHGDPAPERASALPCQRRVRDPDARRGSPPSPRSTCGVGSSRPTALGSSSDARRARSRTCSRWQPTAPTLSASPPPQPTSDSSTGARIPSTTRPSGRAGLPSTGEPGCPAVRRYTPPQHDPRDGDHHRRRRGQGPRSGHPRPVRGARRRARRADRGDLDGLVARPRGGRALSGDLHGAGGRGGPPAPRRHPHPGQRRARGAHDPRRQRRIPDRRQPAAPLVDDRRDAPRGRDLDAVPGRRGGGRDVRRGIGRLVAHDRVRRLGRHARSTGWPRSPPGWGCCRA